MAKMGWPCLSSVMMAVLLSATAIHGLSPADFKGKNVVLFMTDQERATQHFPPNWEEDNLPGLTRLKKNGLSFDRAFTNACMCSPARTTFLTGHFSAQHGVRYTLETNMSPPAYPQVEMPTPDRIENIGTVMSAAGYNVIYKGKLHVDKATGPDGNWTESDAGKYGFTRWNYPDAGANQDLNEGGGNPDGNGDNDERYMYSVGPVELGQEGILQFINTTASLKQPFFLVVSLINPHDVLFYPSKFTESGYNSSMLEGTIKEPDTVGEILITKPNAQAQSRDITSISLGPFSNSTVRVNYLNFYGNLIKKADGYLVNVLDALDAAGLTDDTVVIKTSDHGEMGMAHGRMIQKIFNMYEETTRIPMVISNPKLFPQPRQSAALISHVDFAPTLASLFSSPAKMSNWAGVDYSPIVYGTKDSVQDYVIFTYDDFQTGQPHGPYVQAPQHIRGIREERYKIAQYYTGDAEITKVPSQWEMYDLVNDPLERDNIAWPTYNRTPEQEMEFARLKAKLRAAQKARLAPISGTKAPVSITADTMTTNVTGLVVTDKGNATGLPIFAPNNITLNWKIDLKSNTASTKLTIYSSIGTIRGTAQSSFVADVAADSIVFTGKANLTSGTAALRGFKAYNLDFVDTNNLSGTDGKVTITGEGMYT